MGTIFDGIISIENEIHILLKKNPEAYIWIGFWVSYLENLIIIFGFKFLLSVEVVPNMNCTFVIR